VSSDEAARDESAARIRDALREEFEDEGAYHEWFVRSLGILGDPVAARLAIDTARAVGTTTQGNAYGYRRAFTISPEKETMERIHRLTALRPGIDRPPVVLDAFAGGGSIPFEASRFGCATIAGELNSVAAAILHGTVALPARLGAGFADIIKTWGTHWAQRVEERLASVFPLDEPHDRPAYIWANTVPCPTTGWPTPLAPNLWLSRGRGNDTAVRLDVDQDTGAITPTLVRGREAETAGARSTYKDGTGTSVWTNETFGGDYIRERAAAGQLGQLMLAASIVRPGVRGRLFRAPTEADIAAIAAAGEELARRLPAWEIADLVPSETRFVGPADRSAQYGLRTARDLFSPRQLLTNVTALEELLAVVSEASTKLDGERARALALYLSFALDKAVDWNSRLCTWHPNRVTVGHTFQRHDFAFKWTFAELDGAHSLIPWVVGQIAKTYRATASLTSLSGSLTEPERRAQSEVILGSATDLPLAASSVDAVVTDPPYYDNVMYGECSDFFYVWLKRSLRDTWPELVTLHLSDKETEAVANPALFRDVSTRRARGRQDGGPATASELADRHYEDLLTRSFREAHRVLKSDGVMTVMFTHKRVDAWDTLGRALLEAGFAIHSSWPVHTESEHSLHQAKKNSAASTILLACRKRDTAEPAWWADIRGDVERAAEKSAERFAERGLRGVDLTLATYGPVLSVLSQRWPVYTGELADDGSREVLRPDVALDLARERVATLKKRGLLAGRDVDFDRVTDWYLLAWNDFQAVEFPFDEARKLSIALHLDVDELKQSHKVVRASSGTVTLLTPAERRTAGALDPDASSWETQLDALHALMLVYDEDGLGAARAWLDRTGRRDDQRFSALVEATLNAIPRVRKKDELIRQEARVLESMRQTLFPSIEPPPEPVPPAEQLVLETA
jgi:adenine-specific DNA methylase